VNALKEWVSALESAEGGKETSLEQHFNQKVLVEALGYKLYPGDAATAWPKAPTSATQIAGEPDVCLGRFEPDGEPEFSAVLELKTPRTDLDAPQARSRALTPVQQAFEYGEQMLGVRWILVSNMRRIRLYSVESPHEYIEFDLRDCASPDSPRGFKDLYWLVSEQALIRGGPDSPVSNLYERSAARQLSIRDSFYELYDEIRTDLLRAVSEAAEGLPKRPNWDAVVAATQRLLDRMLFLYYCEDNPTRLIPANTVKEVTESARRMLGPSSSKVYDQLKLLFREIDSGSPPGAAVAFAAYNGELFKHDPILDVIDLPDSIHDKIYMLNDKGKGIQRKVQGVWGLHAFDFWRELNEHLLGHVFERSLSDLEDLAKGAERGANRLKRRRRHGIYYTSELLSDYLSESAVRALLRESAPLPSSRVSKKDMAYRLQARIDHLEQFRIIDFACGSGAFLVSSYQALLEEFWRLQDALDALSPSGPDLLSQSASLTQARLLRETLHGVDLLPQAVEIAKLALWLRSARKGEKVADLSHSIVAGDSLDVSATFAALQSGLGKFDLVIGNPPWGAEMDAAVAQLCCKTLHLDPSQGWDSWELFVALGLACLREGGRLAFVLPDTIFSPEKARIRRLILESGTIELFHNLGTDWFEGVRMGTAVIQVRRGSIPLSSDFPALLLAGEDRKTAIEGKVPLTQLASRFARSIPQQRCAASPTAEIEIFRSARDDDVLETMERGSRALAELCEHGRGEEMAKSGLLWICQNCFTANVPAKKAKRDPKDPEARRYQEKNCQGCGLALNEENVGTDHLVKEGSAPAQDKEALFIDGDDISARYRVVAPNKLLRLDFDDFPFKSGDRYMRPKLLIRQAGVGLLATLDSTGARCPQSVYYYRLTEDAEKEGYSNEFLLGVLLSRTVAYYVFKRFGEVDPARAHAKLTHERLSRFPVPAIDFEDRDQRALHDEVSMNVRLLQEGKAEPGGHEDMRIDIALRELWGISADDGLYINLELARLPAGQVIRELFPRGLPKLVVTSGSADPNGGDPVEFVGIS
jgi:Eco57I restriction-modification methylase/restriction endonuclease TaqI-like protein